MSNPPTKAESTIGVIIGAVLILAVLVPVAVGISLRLWNWALG